MTLQRLALSRSTVDRASGLRSDPELIRKLLDRPGTAVLLLDGDHALVSGPPAEPRLDLLDPPAAIALRDPAAALVAFLGEDGSGRSYLLLATLPDSPMGIAGPAPSADRPEPPDPARQRWADLRSVGDLLDDTGAGLLTSSIALVNWHAAHRHCARCGERTRASQAGWARQCPSCGAEHYPRTDPAVIMAVVDDADRILLGRQARWPDKRFSTLAGFVEPGEALETAVRREVAEEAGIDVGEVRYRGSQPWPFPASLMLGFRARATSTEIRVDGEELAQARWWTREELGLDVATGELLLPPRISIARRLIEEWFGGPIAAREAWR